MPALGQGAHQVDGVRSAGDGEELLRIRFPHQLGNGMRPHFHRFVEADALVRVHVRHLELLAFVLFVREGDIGLTVGQVQENMALLAADGAVETAHENLLDHVIDGADVLFGIPAERDHDDQAAGTLALQADFLGSRAQDHELEVAPVGLVHAGLAIQVSAASGRSGEIMEAVIEGVEGQDRAVIRAHPIGG